MKKFLKYSFWIIVFFFSIYGCNSQTYSSRKYKRIEKRYSKNIDTLLTWSNSQDRFLRLFAALSLSRLDHPASLNALINSIGLTDTVPNKSKDVVIFIPKPRLADIELIKRCEEDYLIILDSIILKFQDQIPFQAGLVLEFLSRMAELDCENNYSGRYTNKNCVGISMDHYNQIEVNFQISSKEEISQQYESVIKPLLVEWFGELVPED